MRDIPLSATIRLICPRRAEVLPTPSRPGRNGGGGDGPPGLARETPCGLVLRRGTKQQPGWLDEFDKAMDGASSICAVFHLTHLRCLQFPPGLHHPIRLKFYRLLVCTPPSLPGSSEITSPYVWCHHDFLLPSPSILCHPRHAIGIAQGRQTVFARPHG